MKNPENRFKAALAAGRPQIGLWNSIGGNTVPEALSGLGYDWVLIDTEHAPVEVTGVMLALQAMAAEPSTSAVVRPDWNDPVKIKRLLDMGAQSLLIPYIQTRDEAEAAVRAVRYPPAGLRGVAGMTRASRFGRVENYTATASEQICLLLQVETSEAMARLEDIAGVDGVDGIFFGPSDISTSMGLPGQPNHPDVKAAILDGIARLRKIGVPAGILTLDRDFARECVEAGTLFTAVGMDLSLLLRAAADLRAEFA